MDGSTILHLAVHPEHPVHFGDDEVQPVVAKVAQSVLPLTQAQSCKAWFALRRFIYSSTAVARTYRAVLAHLPEFAELCQALHLRHDEVKEEEEKEEQESLEEVPCRGVVSWPLNVMNDPR